MRKILSLLFVLVFGGTLVGTAAAAHADVGDVTWANNEIEATLQPDGSLAVVWDFDLVPGPDGARGPVLALAQTRPVAGSDGERAVVEVEDFTVTSPDGVSTEVDRESRNWRAQYRIGDPDVISYGTNHYQIRYTLRGLPYQSQDGANLEWNVIEPGGFAGGLDGVQVRLQLPTSPLVASCAVGTADQAGQPCPVEDTVVELADERLEADEGITIGVRLPAGVVATPVIATFRNTFVDLVLKPEPVPLALTGGLLVAGGSLFGSLRRRFRRSLVDSTVPNLGNKVAMLGTQPPAVTRPPAFPAYLATLAVKGKVGVEDRAAVLVALAQLGYVRLESVQRSGGATMVVHVADGMSHPPTDPVLARAWQYLQEHGELDFGRDLQSAGKFGRTVDGAVRAAATSHAWFVPGVARRAWLLAGGGLLLVAGGFALGAFGFLTYTLGMLPGLALAVAGMLLIGAVSYAARRTPAGATAYAQAQGFQRYLDEVDLDQLRPFLTDDSPFWPWLATRPRSAVAQAFDAKQENDFFPQWWFWRGAMPAGFMFVHVANAASAAGATSSSFSSGGSVSVGSGGGGASGGGW